MTAFSRQSSQAGWGNLVWELRAVNHRFLDMSVRLPESLRALESAVREKLSEKCQRGKIEATLKLTNSQMPLILNEEALQQLAVASEKVRAYVPAVQMDFLAILNWPGVLETENKHQEAIHQQTLILLDKAIDDLIAMRRSEGAQIKIFIQQRLDAILQKVQAISEQIPVLLNAEHQRMMNRFTELKIELDYQRIEQEMAILIQKGDVEEEIQRLVSHCQAMGQALQQPGSMGRRLDFLTQELHREANTLSSKAINVALTHHSVEMKVLIEQIREQVQNIE